MNDPIAGNVASAKSAKQTTYKHPSGAGNVSSPSFKSSSCPAPPATIVAATPAPSRLISTASTPKAKDQRTTILSAVNTKLTSLTRACLRTAIVLATHLHSHGATPLHVAAIRGISDEWLGRLLRAHRSAASVQDRPRSLTPLHVALRYRHTTTTAVQLLVRAQPSCLGIGCRKGHLPIHVAAQYSTSVEIVCYLLTSLPESARSITSDVGDTPLHLAARADNDRGDAIVLTLVDWAPDLALKRNRIGETPFSIVCGLWDAFVSSSVWRDKSRKMILSGDAGIVMESSGLLKRLWNKMSYLAKARYCIISNNAVSQTALISDGHLLHAAMGSSCPSSFVELVLLLHPRQIDEVDRTGRHPLAIAAATNFRSDAEGLNIIDNILSAHPESAAMRDSNDNYPLHLALQSKKTWDFGVRSIFEAFPHAIEKVDASSGLPLFVYAAAADASVRNENAAYELDVKSENFDAGRRIFSARRGKIIPRNDSFEEYMQGVSLQRLLSRNSSLKSWESDLESDEAGTSSDSEAEMEEERDPTESHRQDICREPRDAQASQVETMYRLLRGSPSVLRTKLTSGLQTYQSK